MDLNQHESELGLKSTRGRKPDQLLTKLAVKLQGSDGKPFWKCIALKCTHKAKGNLQASRVLKHSMTCAALREHDRIAYEEANAAGVNGSLSSQILSSESLSTTVPSASTTAVFLQSSDTLITSAGRLNPIPF
jgi:hypothetical protein